MDEKKNLKTENTTMKSELSREEQIVEEMEKTVSEKQKKEPKTFKLWQAAMLLTITLLLSIGGGIAVGNMVGDSDGLDTNRLKDQLQFYEQRLQLDPNNLANRVIYAYTHFLLGNNSEAKKELNWVLNLDPNYFDAHLNLGIINLEEGQLDSAMFSFNETIKIAPRDYQGHMYLGRTFLEMERYDEAIEALTEANNISRANPNIIYYIGLAAEKTEEYEYAEMIYRETLRIDPTFVKALDALTRVQVLTDLALEEVSE